MVELPDMFIITVIHSPRRKRPAWPWVELRYEGREMWSYASFSTESLSRVPCDIRGKHGSSYLYKFGLLWSQLTCKMTWLLSLWAKCAYHSGRAVLALPCWIKFDLGTEMISRSLLSMCRHSFGKGFQDRDLLELIDRMFWVSGKKREKRWVFPCVSSSLVFPWV